MVATPSSNPVDVAPGVLVNDRGFVTNEITSTLVTGPAYGGSMVSGVYPSHFWGSVISGTLLVMSLFVLSWFLMLGCHVGVARDGLLSLGWGAAWWMVITSCIAYYFRGMLAGCISRRTYNGWLKGAAVWGLSIPLAVVIYGLTSGGLMTSLGAPHADVLVGNHSAAVAVMGVNFGYAWTAFCTLILGLIFSIFGSGSAVRAGFGRRTNP